MYVVLGASGNVGSKVAGSLLDMGEGVRVVARHPEKLAALGSRGAEVAPGDMGDRAFLADAMKGARGAFTMIPPAYEAADLYATQARLIDSLVDALQQSDVGQVVNLSSVGAERPKGTGPIVTLHREERRLDALEGLDLLHLRAGYFMENLLHVIEPARAMGFLPGQIEPTVPIEMVATRDIAAEAVARLLDPQGAGSRVEYVLGPGVVTMEAAARALGQAIGTPDLAYQRVPDADAEAALVQAGFHPRVTHLFTEMYAFLSRGEVSIGADVHRGSTTLDEFLASLALARPS